MATSTQKTPGTRGRKPKAANPNIAADTLKAMEENKVPQTAAGAPQATKPEATPAPRSQEAKDDKRFLAVSEGSCLAAMQRAFGFGKSALHLECAAALSVFCFSGNGASREASDRLKEIYAEAGYDIATDGEDYKTIMRRIAAFGKLYTKMDRREIIGAFDGLTEMEAIESLKNYIAQEYNFNGINSILAAAGEPVKQTNTPEYRQNKQAATNQGGQPNNPGSSGSAKDDPQTEKTAEGQRLNKDGSVDQRTKPDAELEQKQGNSPADDATAAKLGERMDNRRSTDAADDRRDRRASDSAPAQLRRNTDQPDAIVFTTENLHIAIPRDISRAEVMEMTTKLMAFAASMNFEEEEQKQRMPANAGRQVAHAGGDRRTH